MDADEDDVELQTGIERLAGDADSTTVFAILGLLDEDNDGNIDPMELIHAIEALDLGIESGSHQGNFESNLGDTRTTSQILEQLLDIIDEQEKSLANAFGDLDDDGNRMLSREELITKLNEILPMVCQKKKQMV